MRSLIVVGPPMRRYGRATGRLERLGTEHGARDGIWLVTEPHPGSTDPDALEATLRGHDERDWQEWGRDLLVESSADIPPGAERAWLKRTKASHRGISGHRSLRHLIATAVDQDFLDEIGTLDGLERLELEWPVTASDLSPLRRLTVLRHLSIDSPRNVTDFTPLLELPEPAPPARRERQAPRRRRMAVGRAPPRGHRPRGQHLDPAACRQPQAVRRPAIAEGPSSWPRCSFGTRISRRSPTVRGWRSSPVPASRRALHSNSYSSAGRTSSAAGSNHGCGHSHERADDRSDPRRLGHGLPRGLPPDGPPGPMGPGRAGER